MVIREILEPFSRPDIGLFDCHIMIAGIFMFVKGGGVSGLAIIW